MSKPEPQISLCYLLLLVSCLSPILPASCVTLPPYLFLSRLTPRPYYPSNRFPHLTRQFHLCNHTKSVPFPIPNRRTDSFPPSSGSPISLGCVSRCSRRRCMEARCYNNRLMKIQQQSIHPLLWTWPDWSRHCPRLQETVLSLWKMSRSCF